jgi:hypothetical protein
MVKLLTLQTFPARVSHPTQPPNVDPLLGVAVNVTVLPLAKFALHVDAQLSPGGELVTVPAPAPAKTTARIGPGPTDRTVVLVCPLAVTVIVVNPPVRRLLPYHSRLWLQSRCWKKTNCLAN